MPNSPKPRLLRETAEIALTEIKRYIETSISEEFSLRRVSAPLYLPVTSQLNDPGESVRFTLPGNPQELEIVRGLHRWLRSQLLRYVIAPGFGVFTVMNAIRPELRQSTTSSPHIGAWAWEQTIEHDDCNPDHLAAVGKRLYTILQKTEEMILGMFPHLTPTLPKRLIFMERSRLAERNPELTEERALYEYLHEHPGRALQLVDENLHSEIYVWNNNVGRPLPISVIAIDSRILTRYGREGSIGGEILRDQLAMQLLHQPHLLN